jgi:hypothetical protein
MNSVQLATSAVGSWLGPFPERVNMKELRVQELYTPLGFLDTHAFQASGQTVSSASWDPLVFTGVYLDHKDRFITAGTLPSSQITFTHTNIVEETYFFGGNIAFSSNATGFRSARLSTPGFASIVATLPAASTIATVLPVSLPITVLAASDTPIELEVYHNAGTDLTVSGEIWIMRIA